MRILLIYNHSKNRGNLSVTTAESGTMQLSPNEESLIFTLYNGNTYNEIVSTANNRINRPFESTKFKKQILNFDLSQFQLSHTNEELFKSHYSMLNIKQLNKSIDSLTTKYIMSEDRNKDNFYREYPFLAKIDTTNNDIIDVDSIVHSDTIVLPIIDNFEVAEKIAIIENAQHATRNSKKKIINNEKDLQTRQLIITKHQVAWHQKFTLPIACFVFFFIGAPLGAIIRKGGLGLPVVVSVIFFVLYHVVSMTGEKAAKTGEWNVEFGLWLSTLIVLPLGLFLTYKATTDAQLMDTESWTKFFKNFDLKKRKRIDT